VKVNNAWQWEPCSLCQAHGKLVNCVDMALPHKHARWIMYSLKQISIAWVSIPLCLSARPCWLIVDQIAQTCLKIFCVYYFNSFWDFFPGLSKSMSIKRVLVTAFSGEVNLTLEDFKSCHRVYALSVPAIRQLFFFPPFPFLPHLSSVLTASGPLFPEVFETLWSISSQSFSIVSLALIDHPKG